MRWLNFVFAASGMVLSPFGPVSEFLQKDNPWHGFDSQDAVLVIARAQKIQSSSCSKWIDTIYSESAGTVLLPQEKDGKWGQALKEWDPWSEDEKDAVEDCERFPCDVKLNETETHAMKAANKADRLKEYVRLIQLRTVFYKNTQVRGNYEFPGNPVEPWSELEKRGFYSKLKRPEIPVLSLRKLDFGKGKVREIKQVLDRRAAKDPSGLEATVWVRDAYTNHYFDSWGEWTHVSCSAPSGKEVLLVQALLVEFDLLKKNDLASRIMRGKMRSAIEENGTHFLDQAYERWARQVPN